MVDNARVCHRWVVEATALTGLGVAASVLVASTGLGLWRRHRDGRMRPVRQMASPTAPEIASSPAAPGKSGAAASRLVNAKDPPRQDTDYRSRSRQLARRGGGAAAGEAVPVQDGLLAGLGVEAGTPVTLLQFSSAFCAPCRATRRVCDEVATMLDGVRHIEVDAEAHLDAVRALNVWRTPTVLVVDAAGRVVQRASGQPSKAQVIAAVAPLLDGVAIPS
jgi:thiol-disulfide isomerase/thioredoxin